VDREEPVRRLLQLASSRRTQWRLVWFGVITMCVAACGSPASTPEIAGTYEAKYEFGTERLVLRSDGSYEQLLVIASTGAKTENTGKWEFDLGRNLVLIYRPLLFDDNLGKLNPAYATPADGSWNLDVHKRFGTIVLSWNDDIGVDLKRVPK
jgi:hypothetical protein